LCLANCKKVDFCKLLGRHPAGGNLTLGVRRENRNGGIALEHTDIVIVGGGIGGCSLGAKLARSGLTTLILERENEYVDRVRGEWIAPWGVVELKALDLYEPLIEAGGHHLKRSIGYDELLSPAEAEANSFSLDLIEGIPGPLTIEHVTLQHVALAQAQKYGAIVKRGVSSVEVTQGTNPRVRYSHEGKLCEHQCRLIVGADGRTSSVRRQIGLKLEEDPVDHLIAGLLVENAHSWPEDLQSIGKVGDIQYLIFPQGGGRVRLYVDYDITDRQRFSGEAGAATMLAAFDMPCVPNSKAIAGGTPCGPCRSNPSQDAWIDNPSVDGVILMGDAAGYNDPINGQGVSVACRDARMLADILMTHKDWHGGIFAPYLEERIERMRRLRQAARFTTLLNARFGPEAEAARVRARRRMMDDPQLMMIMLTPIVGPEAIDASFFEPGFNEALFAE
jgi:2-polyprenyl-6-methoxyphenol hydroxylase-like FAD-dependent oxidoreductase